MAHRPGGGVLDADSGHLVVFVTALVDTKAGSGLRLEATLVANAVRRDRDIATLAGRSSRLFDAQGFVYVAARPLTIGSSERTVLPRGMNRGSTWND